MRRKKTKIISFIFTLFILFWIFHTPFLRAWRIIFPPSHEFIALQAYGYIKEKLPKEKRKFSYTFDVIDGLLLIHLFPF